MSGSPPALPAQQERAFLFAGAARLTHEGKTTVRCQPSFPHTLPSLQVIEAEKSFVSMVPTKVEITLRKANPGAWARLEHPQSKACAQGEPEKAAVSTEEPEDDSDDSLSWSEEDEEVEAADGAAPLRGFGESSARAHGAPSSP